MEGLPIDVRTIDKQDLVEGAEAFVTSIAGDIILVTRVNRTPLENGAPGPSRRPTSLKPTGRGVCRRLACNAGRGYPDVLRRVRFQSVKGRAPVRRGVGLLVGTCRAQHSRVPIDRTDDL